jgi:ATP-dependent DNA helicase RecG
MSTIRLKVFISSVQKEMRTERAAVGGLLATDSFLSKTTVPRLFEEYPAPLRPNKRGYLDLLLTCNVYLLIIGREYGHALEDGLSATEQEYQLAQELHLPTLVCVKGDNAFEREEKAAALLQRIKNDGYTYSRFNSAEELLEVARERLIEHINKEFDTQPTPSQNQAASETLHAASDFERQPVTTLALVDLDEKLARELVAAAEDKPVERLNADAVREGLLSRSYLWFDAKEQVYRPTVAAALLLARSPAKAVAQARVQLDAYAGDRHNSTPLDSVLIDAPLPHAIEQAVAFVRRNTSQPLKVEGLRRARAEAYPQEALREAIANAVAHRDYADAGAKVTVEVFADRVVIASPGGPPGNQSMERISRGEGRSRARNPLTVQGLTWLELMDERGSGIRRMQEASSEVGGQPPSFKLVEGDFTVTLYAAATAEPPPSLNTAKSTDSAPEGGPAVPFPGSDRQREIVRILEAKDWISSGVVVQKLGIVKDTAVRDLNELVKADLLRKEGTGRGTRYYPTEAGKRYFSSDYRPTIGRKSGTNRT